MAFCNRAPPDPPYNDEGKPKRRKGGLDSGSVKRQEYYKYPCPFWGPVGWPSHFVGLGPQKPHWTPGWTRPGCESSGGFGTLYGCPWREGPSWTVAVANERRGRRVRRKPGNDSISFALFARSPRCLDSLTQKRFLHDLGHFSCARYMNAHVLVSTSVWRS